jgi:tetratricopeptide (TPR) repeat protein
MGIGREGERVALVAAPAAARATVEAATPGLDRQLARVGLGMIALGAIRLGPLLEPWSWFFSRLLRARSLPSWHWFEDPSGGVPLGAVLAAWPIGLGLVLWRGRRPRLARAAAITCVALAADRLLALSLGLAFGAQADLAGRFDWPILPVGLPWRLRLATLVGAPLALEALVAWRALRADRQYRRGLAARPGRRRELAGRMVGLAAAVVALLAVGLSLWDGYLQVLVVYPSVRQMVLRADRYIPHRRGPDPRPLPPAVRRGYDALGEAQVFLEDRRYREARRAYFEAWKQFELAAEDFPRRREYREARAQAHNNLAWFLATCPDPQYRNPRRAVELAERGVALLPRDGNIWNTLGVARYRAGDPDNAAKALEKAMHLRLGGDSFDWFFLAMIRHAEGDREQALRLYSEASRWMEANLPFNPELALFRAEAAERLGLPAPPPPPVRERPPVVGRRRGRPLLRN